MKINVPRGTADILPEEAELWNYIEEKAKNAFKRYNYLEIRTPIFEQTELFQKGVGETTDIVEKEMYTFKDKSDRSLTLRPEGTAPVVRSFVENKLYSSPDPVKLYYNGPMFRYERPQSGRTRQFTQIGVEALGSNDPSIDAEVISLAIKQFEDMGLQDLRLELNSVGCKKCRPVHRASLVAHLKESKDQLCKDCRSRLERNPMRILDCKNESCKLLTASAPTIDQFLCDDCQEHYTSVKEYLTALNIDYVENPRLVRGLDYYTQTAFEIIADSIGAIGTICGGGRYNGLVSEMGGDDVPGIGFAYSLERISLALKTQGVEPSEKKDLDAYLISLGEPAKKTAAILLNQLRNQGLKAEMDYLDRKMKAQMKAADRAKASYVIIIGEDELASNQLIVRNMLNGEQETQPFEALAGYLAKKIIEGS